MHDDFVCHLVADALMRYQLGVSFTGSAARFRYRTTSRFSFFEQTVTGELHTAAVCFNSCHRLLLYLFVHEQHRADQYSFKQRGRVRRRASLP